ncbi:hypothetical protein [Bryobacter aggregatus]|nr:hypothetical protein [Bryobacter aggregatus]
MDNRSAHKVDGVCGKARSLFSLEQSLSETRELGTVLGGLGSW